MPKLILFLCFFILSSSCQSQSDQSISPIITGAEQIESYLSMIRGKKIALVVNQTSVIGSTHLIDTLLSINKRKKLQISIDKVFAPEHGFRGDAEAGEQVKNGLDQRTGIPIISLYGKNKKPTKKQLEGIDYVIFDIQDVGVRFYTYISTMHYVMEACATHQVKLIILDRPNPNGMYVDGPVLDTAMRSFVGMHPIPIVHGLTVGELANMIVGEKWLNTNNKLQINIVKMQNYNHTMHYSLPIKPSPNLPNDLSVALYPSLCLFEGTDISVGRGTFSPFLQIGHPNFDTTLHKFTPKSIPGMSKYPKHENKVCYGINFVENVPQYRFELKYIIDFYKQFQQKDQYFNSFFKKLAGTPLLQEQIQSGLSEDAIRASWQKKLSHYKAIRKKYLLYKDFYDL